MKKEILKALQIENHRSFEIVSQDKSNICIKAKKNISSSIITKDLFNILSSLENYQNICKIKATQDKIKIVL